jgi:hypothetical protein
MAAVPDGRYRAKDAGSGRFSQIRLIFMDIALKIPGNR